MVSRKRSLPIYGLLESRGLARRYDDQHLLLQAVQNLTLYTPPSGEQEYRFLWRGQRDDRWGLESRLYRSLIDQYDRPPTRIEFEARENEILEAFHETSLAEDRTVLDQLALLQHHGAPTRLLDVSTDYLPALYFACEDAKIQSRRDGVLLAFLASAATGELKPNADIPTVTVLRTRAAEGALYYQPRPVTERIRNQRAAFIVTDVPNRTSNGAMAIRWPMPDAPWKPATLQKVLSPPTTWTSGRPARPVIIGFCIAAQLKPAILSYLDRVFRINGNSVYPDIQGFVASLT